MASVGYVGSSCAPPTATAGMPWKRILIPEAGFDCFSLLHDIGYGQCGTGLWMRASEKSMVVKR